VEAITDNIPVIVDFVNDKLEKMNCTPKAMAQIDVAIDEIASNIAYYAYKDSIGFMFVVIEELDDDGNVMMRFEDGGMPYNPLEREDPDISKNVEDREVGGLGIHIVKKTMDDVKYVYRNGRNILVLFKKIR
jgi:serine/threonine-protein kinase RsbW